MSHIAEYTTVLTEVDIELFKKAMEIVAETLDGNISDTIDSYDEGYNLTSWRNNDIEMSIRTPNLPQGVGACFEKGKLVFLCDILQIAEKTTSLVGNELFHSLESESRKDFKAIQERITNLYTTLALGKVLAERGYKTDVTSVNGGTVIRAKKAVKG